LKSDVLACIQYHIHEIQPSVELLLLLNECIVEDPARACAGSAFSCLQGEC